MDKTDISVKRQFLVLVHLDLKGAPPKVSYLAEIFPLFAQLGASGILIEYEDMFPYGGKLEVLKSKYAYSPSEIKSILHLAKSNGLEVIPLVQTFGHMEFVLKHGEFSHLREVENFPNALNPHKVGSLELVHLMIDQVMALHEDVKWFHIGCDEVFFLGEGEESKMCLKQGQNHVDRLFLSHVKAVAQHIVTAYQGVKPIIWDDMLRDSPEDHIKESDVALLVEPMIWDYSPEFDINGKVSLAEKYQKCGFNKIWFASAFKGATGANQQLTHVRHHLENQFLWLQVAKAFPGDLVQGITLTGWQRYDHYSVLCELLPVGMPCLAVCLQAVAHGQFSEKEDETVKKCLGLSSLDTNSVVSDDFGTFPGNDILRLVTEAAFQLAASTESLLKGNRYVTGWFSPYHRKHKFVNPMMVQYFENECRSLLSKWEQHAEQLRSAMENIYYPNTMEEWFDEYFNPFLTKLQQLVFDLDHVSNT
ncbi:hexosaminidase D [Protopterus annectens]|uniref:hexosaminidase D n=1 Tax=Protopterus annectens TaxID=7888 RepID=UPI001CF9B82D|nr:hexosaminidase D [Protopterus annectens]